MSRETAPLSMPASSRRGLPYLADVHSFRAIAITAVVATHVMDYLGWENSPGPARDVALSLFQNGSVMFVFIAGLLFQYLSRDFSYRRYLGTKVRYVFVPYVVASLPTLAHQYWRKFGVFSPQIYHGNPLRTVLSALVKASHLPRPFWFIPMIGLFYVAAPVFLWLDRKAKAYLLVVPVLLLVAGFAHRPLPINRPFHAFVYFLPSYVAGMAASKYREHWAAVASKSLSRWGLTGLALVFLVFEVGCLGRGGPLWSTTPWSSTLWSTTPWSSTPWSSTLWSPIPFALDSNQLFKLLQSAAILSWLAVAGDRVHRGLFRLAELSFGVFFVHEYVLYAFSRVHERLSAPGSAPTIAHIIIGTLLATLGSLMVVATIKRLTGRWSRYVIGC
jgi:probable poly-beta-1,6-N-acetyl-D-glucosamine export protein